MNLLLHYLLWKLGLLGRAATVTYMVEPESQSVILIFSWVHIPSTLICFYSNGYLIIPYFSRKPIFHSAATSTSEVPLNDPTISLTVWLLSCYSKSVVWVLVSTVQNYLAELD